MPHKKSPEKKLELAAKRWARAAEFYDKKRITTAAALAAALDGETESKKPAILKEHITIRVVGYGWMQFKTPWSVAGFPVSVASLTAKAKAMFAAEILLTKPDESLRTVTKGWTLVKYEDDGEEEWLRLKDFNCMNISSWRLDLDYADLDLEGKSGSMDLDEIDNSKDGDGDEVDDDEDEGDEGHSSEMNDDDDDED